MYEPTPGWNGVNGRPQFVTYSFEQDGTAGFLKPWAPFSTAQEAATRAALAQWSSVSGLTFVEVPDTAGGQGINMRFGLHELGLGDSGREVVGEAYFPRWGETWRSTCPPTAAGQRGRLSRKRCCTRSATPSG